MSQPFSEIEIQLIEKEISRKPFHDIAFLLDRDVKEVASFVKEHFLESDVVVFQKPKKEIIKKEKAPRPVKVKVVKEKKPKEPRPRKTPESKIISRKIVQEQFVKRAADRQPKFQTKKVDYSKLTTIRIDNRTVIYAKPGECPNAVKERFFQTYPKYAPLQ